MGTICTHLRRNQRKRQEADGTTIEYSVSMSSWRQMVSVNNAGFQVRGHPSISLELQEEATSTLKSRNRTSSARVVMSDQNGFTHSASTSRTFTDGTLLGQKQPICTGKKKK